MSIIIKTELEKMPHDCYGCPYSQHGRVWKFNGEYKNSRYVEYSYSCGITNKAMTSTKRNRFCPLIEEEE